MTNRVATYGWNTGNGPQSCGYLSPVIIAWLAKLEARDVLDLGAGNGALCCTMVDAGYEVVGVEPDAKGIEIARLQCPRAQFYQLSVDELPEAIVSDHPNLFDVVVSTEVIEHLYMPQHLPVFAHNLLKKNGYLLLTTPYHGYLKNLAISLTDGWDRHLDPFWTGGHIKFFSRQTITRMLKEAGFHVVYFGGIGRIPYLWKSMLVVAIKV